MTDKQIIIDGVPVQDCCYFDYENDGYEDSCYIHQNECSAQNCYYKQLKRKEQECEELKNELIDIKWKIEAQDIELNDNIEQLDQLKAENEELKKVSCKFKDYCTCDTEKLKQTLTEIKEIAEFDCSCGHNQMCICNVCDKFDEILQKCEVLDE